MTKNKRKRGRGWPIFLKKNSENDKRPTEHSKSNIIVVKRQSDEIGVYLHNMTYIDRIPIGQLVKGQEF